jgi:hypothetical protein
MLTLQLITFGLIISWLVLAWGLLMALSPTRFWDLAKVDWNADVIDTRDRHKRHLVRIAGWIITLLSGALIVGLLIVVIREI